MNLTIEKDGVSWLKSFAFFYEDLISIYNFPMILIKLQIELYLAYSNARRICYCQNKDIINMSILVSLKMRLPLVDSLAIHDDYLKKRPIFGKLWIQYFRKATQKRIEKRSITSRGLY